MSNSRRLASAVLYMPAARCCRYHRPHNMRCSLSQHRSSNKRTYPDTRRRGDRDKSNLTDSRPLTMQSFGSWAELTGSWTVRWLALLLLCKKTMLLS